MLLCMDYSNLISGKQAQTEPEMPHDYMTQTNSLRPNTASTHQRHKHGPGVLGTKQKEHILFYLLVYLLYYGDHHNQTFGNVTVMLT